MDKPWLEQYDKDVSHQIDPDKYNSLVDIYNESIKRFYSNKAYTSFGVSITFEQLHEKTTHLASYFQNVLGIKKGDRAAVMMPNLIQYPIVLFSLLRIGAVVVSVNPLYTAHELSKVLNDSGATTLVVCDNFANTFQQIQADTPVKKYVVTTQIGDMLGFVKSKLVNFVIKNVKRWSLNMTCQMQLIFMIVSGWVKNMIIRRLMLRVKILHFYNILEVRQGLVKVLF